MTEIIESPILTYIFRSAILPTMLLFTDTMTVYSLVCPISICTLSLAVWNDIDPLVSLSTDREYTPPIAFSSYCYLLPSNVENFLA